jgi:superfamily II DNA/RNA helicase
MHIHRWSDRIGRSTIQDITKLKIPSWTNGLYDYQLDMVAAVLDRKNVLASLGTGSGKTAGFAIPVLVLREISKNPHLYPDLRYPEMAVGIVITPTKGLSFDIVSGLILWIGVYITFKF